MSASSQQQGICGNWSCWQAACLGHMPSPSCARLGDHFAFYRGRIMIYSPTKTSHSGGKMHSPKGNQDINSLLLFLYFFFLLCVFSLSCQGNRAISKEGGITLGGYWADEWRGTDFSLSLHFLRYVFWETYRSILNKLPALPLLCVSALCPWRICMYGSQSPKPSFQCLCGTLISLSAFLLKHT